MAQIPLHDAIVRLAGRYLAVALCLALPQLAPASEPNPAGFTFTVPGSVRHGDTILVHTSAVTSEGVTPIAEGLQLLRAWFDHYGWSDHPCFVDGKIMEYDHQVVSCLGPYCLPCVWSEGHEFSSTWYGGPTFEFLVTGCGEGSLRFSVWGGQHEGPFLTEPQTFRITGYATASFEGPSSAGICDDEEAGFTFTGCADTVTWDFGDGSTASGRTVHHRWREPGTYTVTVTGRSGDAHASASGSYTVSPCAALVGTVHAADTGEPLVGATVVAADGSGSRAGRAGAPEGVFLVRVPAPGSYDVTADQPGYRQGSMHVEVSDGQETSAYLAFVLAPDDVPDDDDHRLGDQPDDEDDPVNAYTGNLHLRRTVCAYPATPVLGFRFTLAYNSLAASKDGPVGHGWTHSWAMRATLSATEASISFPDGHVQRFVRAQAGDPWQPAGGATLAVLEDAAGGGVRARLAGGVILEFDASGALTAMGDGTGAEMTVTRGASGVDHVTDPLGRQFDFTHDAAGRLASVRCAAITANDLVTLAYDGSGDLVTVTDPLGHSWQFTYDTSHRLLTETDRRGKTVLTVVYDAEGKVLSETDALGKTTTFSRTALPGGGLEVTITPPSGRAVRRVYNAAGRLVKAVDGLGHAARFAWQEGRLASVTDKAGGTLALHYDADGRILSATGPDGATASLVRDGSGRPAELHRPSGGFDRLEHDAAGRLTRLTSAGGQDLILDYDTDGRVQRTSDRADYEWRWFTWNGSGQLQSIQLQTGATVSFTYDAAGRLASIQRPGSLGTSTFSWDLAGSLEWLRTPEGRRILWTHDAEGNVATRTFEPTGAVTTWIRDDAGQLVTVRDALGGETRYTYDDDGNLVSVTDPDGVTFSRVYDGRGALSEVVLPGGGRRRYERDPAGRVTAIVEPDGGRWTFERDANGVLTGITDPLGNRETFRASEDGLRVVHTDALGRETVQVLGQDGLPRSIESPGGAQTVLDWDTRGRLISLRDPLGSVWTWRYDPGGRLVRETGPDRLAERYVYDEGGRRTRTILPDGREIQYAWNADDELVSTTLPGGTVLGRTRTFDGSGETVSVTDGSETVTDRYDLLGRPVAHTGIWGDTVRRSWTAGGRVDAVEYPGGVTADYRYDTAGRLDRIVDWAGNTTVFHYDTAGRVSSVDLPGGVRTAYGRDPAGRLVSVRHTAPGGATILEITLVRDALGRVVSETRTGGAVPGPDEESTAFERGTADRLESVAAEGVAGPVAHDPSGNLVSAPGLQVTWDVLSRPVTVTRDGVRADYRYDPAGDLVEIASEGVTRRFLRLDGHPVATMDGTGAVLWRHVWAGSILLYSVGPAGEVRVYLGDARGNVAAVTDGSGTVVQTASWDAFGNRTGATGSLTDQPFGFAGTWGVFTDSTGLAVTAARLYDPRLRQFLSEDPAGIRLAGNLYSWAHGDPIDAADPTGLEAGPLTDPSLYQFVKTWVTEGAQMGVRDVGALHGWIEASAAESMGAPVHLMEEATLGSGLTEGIKAYHVPMEWSVDVLKNEGISVTEQVAAEFEMALGPPERMIAQGERILGRNPGIVQSAKQLLQRALSSGTVRGAGAWLRGAGKDLTVNYMVFKVYLEETLAETFVVSLGEASVGPLVLGPLAAGGAGWLVGRAIGHAHVWWDSEGRAITLDEILVHLMSPTADPYDPADEARFIRDLLQANGISWSTYAKWQRQMREAR